jgi:hypothetical protein
MVGLKQQMKLEHRSQKVIPLSRFYGRVARYAIFAVFLIILSVAIGMTGYHFLARLDWLDSFHMACLILTGMGPTAEMTTPAAKIFSSLYALYSGVAFLTIAAVFLAPVIHRFLHLLHVEADNDTN